MILRIGFSNKAILKTRNKIMMTKLLLLEKMKAYFSTNSKELIAIMMMVMHSLWPLLLSTESLSSQEQELPNTRKNIKRLQKSCNKRKRIDKI